MAKEHSRSRIAGLIDSTSFPLGNVVYKNICLYWLKADSLVGYNNDDPVTTWKPEKGSDWVAQLGTPIYKTNIINGLPAIYLANNTYFRFPSCNARTIMGVLSSQTDGNYRFFMGNSAYGYEWHGGTTVWAESGYAHANWQNAELFKSGVYQGIARNVAKSSSIFQWSFVLANGTLVTDTFCFDRESSNRNLLGYVAEIFIFDNVLDASDFSVVTDYLKTKYVL